MTRKSKKTKVVHHKHEAYTVNVARPSRWSNPYKIGQDVDYGQPLTREDVIILYFNHLMRSPDLLTKLHTLKGEILACWCKPQSCHGDILAALADTLDILFTHGFTVYDPPPLRLEYHEGNWYVMFDKYTLNGITYPPICCITTNLNKGIQDVLKWSYSQRVEETKK